MITALEAIAEILSWVGLGVGAIVGLIAVVALIADGTWVRVRGFVEHEAGGAVIRWFDEDGRARAATLSEGQVAHLGGADAADVWTRRGAERVRFTRHSPAVRAWALLAGLLLAVGVVSLLASLALLFVS
ncbi:hypothetical protein ACIQLJ_08400 [Microbacterium sp. NPDC091313]